MESELSGLIRALGSNHLYTAERYKDFAIYLYEFDSINSLLYFEKAYSIYNQHDPSDYNPEMETSTFLNSTNLPLNNI